MSGESSPTDVVRNLVFLGTLGSGKTSICNTITGIPNQLFSDPSLHSNNYLCESKRLRLFDTSTLENDILSAENIEQTYKWISSVFSDWKENDSSGQIDAFLLVVKLNPRAQTLKADLKKIRDLFGTVAFKSLILVPIYHEESHPKRRDFLQILKQMNEVIAILQEGKEEEPNENWFCVWNNIHPNKNQEKELLNKIGQLEPYTTQKFIGSSEEIKRRMNKRLEKELKRGDLPAQEHTQRRKAFLEAVESVQRGVQELDSMIRNINSTTKIALETLYQGSAHQRELLVNKFIEQIQVNHKEYERKFHRHLRENEKTFEAFREELETRFGGNNDEVQENRKFGEQLKELLFGKEPPKKKGKLLKETSKREAKIAAKTGSEIATKQGPVEVAKASAKNLRGRCNIF